MKKLVILAFVSAAALSFIGCATGGQPVVWNKAEAVDFTKTATVEVTATVPVPEKEIQFMVKDIEAKLDKLFTGDKKSKDRYLIKINITKYEEGSAFARFMLIGLGQMYLYGDVEVKNGTPSVVVRSGDFKKNYCLGGIAGACADMHETMNAKVADSLVEALKGNKVGK